MCQPVPLGFSALAANRPDNKSGRQHGGNLIQTVGRRRSCRFTMSYPPGGPKAARNSPQPNGLIMQTICELLRRTRLDQGIDLATVAALTRIDAKYLRAIEADDSKSLPGDFYYKSFVHQYATCLRLDTKAIDAEVDRVLSAEASLPLPGMARQSAEKLSFQ